MTTLEAKIAALLAEVEKLLEPTVDVDQGGRWILISESQQQLRPVRDGRAALTYSYARASQAISKLTSYSDAKQAFERDSVFADAKRKAGYWATFEAVLQHLIRSSGRMRRHNVFLDSSKALEVFRSLRSAFTQKDLQYQASVRLMGVKLRCKQLTLPDRVTFHRLTRRERNARQPVVLPYLLSGWEDQGLVFHSTEARVPLTIPVDHTQDGAFFKAQNDAQQVAGEIFARVLHAILLASSGAAQLGAMDLSGGVQQIPVGRSLVRGYVPGVSIRIGRSDLRRIETAYDLVSGGPVADRVLGRSLHRFLLGRQRMDQTDRLVDLVIAWEAILLTQEGNPIAQELSYRFGINGAAILRAARLSGAEEAYRKMRAAYSTRSWVVHGGDDQQRDKALQAGQFANLQELCDFLEQGFRDVAFWLAKQEPRDRPYHATGGWERLLWS